MKNTYNKELSQLKTFLSTLCSDCSGSTNCNACRAKALLKADYHKLSYIQKLANQRAIYKVLDLWQENRKAILFGEISFEKLLGKLLEDTIKQGDF